MSRRRLIAAGLHVAAGLFVAGTVGTLWVCAAMLAPMFEGSFVPGLVAMFGRPVAIVLIGFGVLEVAAAIALLRGSSWARMVLLTVSAVLLFVFPVGTALSIYTGWALASSIRPAVA